MFYCFCGFKTICEFCEEYKYLYIADVHVHTSVNKVAVLMRGVATPRNVQKTVSPIPEQMILSSQCIRGIATPFPDIAIRSTPKVLT